jgi:ribonuclease Z
MGYEVGGMVKLLILGSSCLLCTEAHHPTHLAFLGPNHGLLVDCGVSPRGRLEGLGVGRDAVDDIFITHFHPDHVAGLPQYLMELWLLGRKKPITVHAGEVCLTRIRKMMEMYEWHHGPDVFPVEFHPVRMMTGTAVLENGDFRVTASPVRHMVPTTAIRVDSLSGAKSVAVSSDTEPSPELVILAKGADILLHEATGEGVGHSSAAQAAEIARQAGVRNLILIHYCPDADAADLAAAARTAFPGEVEVAVDRMEILLGG